MKFQSVVNLRQSNLYMQRKNALIEQKHAIADQKRKLQTQAIDKYKDELHVKKEKKVEKKVPTVVKSAKYILTLKKEREKESAKKAKEQEKA